MVKFRNGSNEFEVRGSDVYVNGNRAGYKSGDDLRMQNGDTYRMTSSNVYKNNENVGYRTGDGDIRTKDGSLWESLFG